MLTVIQTSNRCWPASTRISRWSTPALARSSTPKHRATAPGSNAGSATALRSITPAPSPKPGDTAAATSTASRVLPTPPAPTSVTSRFTATSRATCASSLFRPTNRVSGTGNPAASYSRHPSPAPRAMPVMLPNLPSVTKPLPRRQVKTRPAINGGDRAGANTYLVYALSPIPDSGPRP